jgi:nitrogen fixation/metabolism regulation signal transduction histidine kinase
MEATALLSAVIKEIDVAIFAFDSERILRLVNPAGQVLIGQPAERLLGRSAQAIGLEECLDGEPNRILGPNILPRASGRWGMRRLPFREGGRPHQLVVFGDLSRPLREEQLAPIKSIAATLETSMDRLPRPPDWAEDMKSGLGIITSRSESLEKFLQGYTRLAKLPPPQSAPFDLPAMLRRAAALERRLEVEVDAGVPVELVADEAQLEQAVINLVKNAVEASLDQQTPVVRISWRTAGANAEICIDDNGTGIGDTANLFVPFFTTKPGGSGIGLALCQQIAENHGGSIGLYNRDDRSGCSAILRLPLPKR